MVNKNELFQTPLFSVFNNVTALILDVLLMLRELDYSETDISKKTGLSRKTVAKEVKRLLEKKVIVLTRKSGKSNMYRFNDILENAWLKTHFDSKIGLDDDDDICKPDIEIDTTLSLEQLLQQYHKQQMTKNK